MALGGQGQTKGRENGINGNHHDSLEATAAYFEDEDQTSNEKPLLRPWDEATFREPSLFEMNSVVGEFFHHSMKGESLHKQGKDVCQNLD